MKTISKHSDKDFSIDLDSMRGNRTASFFSIIFFVTLIVFTIQLYLNKFSDPVKLSRIEQKSIIIDETNQTSAHSKERENIFFLKAHKCGSSTVQNVLLRYGRENHLSFVLPYKENYIGNPKKFNTELIAEHLRTEDNTYNILTHHIRYNATAVKSIMKPDAAFVTILRDPGTLFESLYNFYHLERRLNVSFETFRGNPENFTHLLYTRKGYRYGRNQMCFDLGLTERSFYIENRVNDFIRKIEREFDLVMISEYMESSLILLSDLMGWSLDRVVFLNNNVRQPHKKTNLTDAEKQKFRSINQADTKLYNHFLDIFKTKIEAYGVERMKHQVDKLISMNFDFYQQCVDQVTTEGYARTYTYDIKPGATLQCSYAATQELNFTEQLRKEQIYKLSQLRKLGTLMSSTLSKKEEGYGKSIY